MTVEFILVLVALQAIPVAVFIIVSWCWEHNRSRPTLARHQPKVRR
jgi:hypothetical protein